MNGTKFSLFAAICTSLVVGCSLGPPTVIQHKAPPSASIASSQNQIDDFIRKGDEAYDNENFVAAKSYYYQAMIAQPNPTPYVLASYGLALSQLGNFDNAHEIFKMAEAKYPNNEVIRKGIAISNRIYEEQREQQRQMELARQQQLEKEKQEAESTANKMREFGNALQDFADAVDAYQGGHQKSQSSNNATSYSGSQSNNNSRASTSKSNNYNCASASKRYSSAKSSAESACGRHRDNPNGDLAGYAKADCNKALSNVESIRSEAARNGCRL